MSKYQRANSGALGDRIKFEESKAAFLGESSREAKRIQQERQLKLEYARWFASMNPQEQASVRKLGLHKPLLESPRRGAIPAQKGADVDFCDPADLPEASVDEHPMHILEPQSDSIEIEGITHQEIKETSEIFNCALRWALEGGTLVGMGGRTAVMVSVFREDLACGLNPDPGLKKSFMRRVLYLDSSNLKAAVHMSRLTGEVFGRALEWVRRGGSLSALGERLYLMAYVLRPQLINGSTLAALGVINGKSRQAKDKGVNCLRDTFSGIKSYTMRETITRLRCKQSQLAPALS